jgi:uncharacterized protein
VKQRTVSLFVGGLFVLALIGVAAADQFADGQAAYRHGEYATAMRLWRPLADKANAGAQLSIGDMYYYGQGVPKDYARAAIWYRRAAEIWSTVSNDRAKASNKVIGDAPDEAKANLSLLTEPVPDLLGQWNSSLQSSAAPRADVDLGSLWVGPASRTPSQAAAGPLEEGDAATERGDYAAAMQIWRTLADKGDDLAQVRIGNLYWNGRGVSKDDSQAINWGQKAANAGNPEAQTDVGGVYSDGTGVPQDFGQAIAWYLKAANQGYRVAQDRIGAMYEKGQGVEQDYVQAHMWFNLATANEKDSTLRAAWMSDRNEVAAKMTPAQIAEAQRLRVNGFRSELADAGPSTTGAEKRAPCFPYASQGQFWEARPSNISVKSLISMVGAQGLEPWTR